MADYLTTGSKNAGDEEIPKLITALDGSSEERLAAKQQLLLLGDTAVEPLVQVVQNEVGRQAWTAVDILGELAAPGTFPVLLATLHSDDPLLSGMALQALLNFTNHDILPHLAQALPHVHIITQQNIILTLQKLADMRAVNLLIDQLAQVTSPTIRTALIKTLGQLGDPAAIAAIRAYKNDSNHHVREWTAVAIQQLEAAAQQANL